MTPKPVAEPGVKALRVLVRGAGEMATGIACRLFRSGFRVAMTEREHPTAVRRAVAFSEAVWEGNWEVEGTRARLVGAHGRFDELAERGEIPVAVDPELRCLEPWAPQVLIDATVAKRNLGIRRGMAEWVIGFGPGFTAGVDADVVVETNRGHDLGRLIFEGRAQPDTGVPAPVLGFAEERVLRAPGRGVFRAAAEIGSSVEPGQVLGHVEGEAVRNRIRGVLRGLLRGGIEVDRGQKIGDVDPRGETRLCFTISDKARALGGSALEAILMRFNR